MMCGGSLSDQYTDHPHLSALSLLSASLSGGCLPRRGLGSLAAGVKNPVRTFSLLLGTLMPFVFVVYTVRAHSASTLDSRMIITQARV
jgi:hypothetical protein